MSSYEALRDFSDKMKLLYSEINKDLEKQKTINFEFSRLLIFHITDIVLNTNTNIFCEFVSNKNTKIDLVRNIDYSKIPYYLSLTGNNNKREIRIFISPTDISKCYIGSYIYTNPKIKKSIGPDEQIVEMKAFNNASVLFSICDFLSGCVDHVDFSPTDLNNHGRIH